VSRQTERTAATRAALIAAGRALFVAHGFAAVSIEEIVTRAGLTRGALYHHFKDKRDVFRAVHEEVEAELTRSIGAKLATMRVEDPAAALVAGTRAFLDSCVDPAVARIALTEAPAVLGWSEWRQVQERHGLGLVIASLQAAMDAGALRRQPVRPLAHMLLSAHVEAGLMIVDAEDPSRMRNEVEAALLSLLEGLGPGDGRDDLADGP
jgi:AcrR family transcriptional regulator